MRKARPILVSYDILNSALEVGVVSILRWLHRKYKQPFIVKQAKEIKRSDLRSCLFYINVRGADEAQCQVLEMAKKLGVLSIYFLDDDLLNMNEFLSVNNRIFFEQEAVKANIMKSMELADCLWTVNEELGNKYAHLFAHHFTTKAPALLLHEDHDIGVGGIGSEKRPIVIGFMGGLDHRLFFESLLKRPFQKLQRELGDQIQFFIYGFAPYEMYNIPIAVLPYDVEYDSYKKRAMELKIDIGLAPLPITEFHRMKYINKFLEYGGLGIPAIYSDIAPYNKVVQHMETGYLAANDQDIWYEAMLKLIHDEQLRHSLGQQGLSYVKENYGLEQVGEEVLDNFRRLRWTLKQ